MEGFIWLMHPVPQSFKGSQGRSSKWASGKFKATRCKCRGTFKVTKGQGQHLSFTNTIYSLVWQTPNLQLLKKPTGWAEADAQAKEDCFLLAGSL